MAIVGEAHIIIRPITAGFERAVARDMNKLTGISGSAGRKAGTAFHKAFGSKGMKLFSDDTITKALSTQKAWASLQRTGFSLQTVAGTLVSSLGALGGGLVALGSAALSAVPAVMALGGAFASLAVGMITARLALGGVGAAVSALNKNATKGAADNTAAIRRVEDAKRNLLRVIRDNEEAVLDAEDNITKSKDKLTDAQNALNKALKEGAEELQQLNFDAEDAALAEQKAAMELEDARKTLARVQDLPPNSRARREAELAYREADLNLRRAKDKNADLRAEQERLAKSGVEGTDVVIKARQDIADAETDVQDALKESEKTAIDAAEREGDARRELARANEDLAKKDSGAGGTDPLAGLTESQKTFAKFLAGLKPKIDELKEAAAATFLPKLQQALDSLFSGPTFGVWKKGLGEVGDALGNASIKIADAIRDAGNLKDLGQLFSDSAKNIEGIGSVIGNVWGIALGVLNAAQPLTEKFIGWLDSSTSKWESFLDTEEGKKKLTDFFNEAGRVAGELGTIFGNTFGGLFNIIKANTGPGTGGQILLDYFKEITANFKEFSGSASGQNVLKKYFADAAENTKSILSFFGELVKMILQLGADPNVKVFWDTLKGALPYLQQILSAGTEAGPVFAELLVNLAKIFAAILDAGALKTFFGILNTVAGVIANIAQSEFGGWIIKIVGYLQGFFLALGFLGSLLSGVGSLLLGIVANAFNVVSKLISFMTGVFRVLGPVINIVVGAFRALGIAIMANPIGAIIAAIVLLIGLFVLLYNKNEAFRNFVNAAWEAIKNAIKVVVDWIMEIAPKIWDGIKTGLQAAWNFVKTIWDAIVAGVKIYIGLVTLPLRILWDVLKTGLELAWRGAKGVWDTIVGFVGGLGAKITSAASGMWNGLKSGLQGVINFIIGGVNWIIRALNKISFTFPSWVPGLGGKKFGLDLREISPVQLAAGGIVSPTNGGVLAQIAEAGRPERVEPLDPDGLSKRDKAMIKFLTGSGTSGATFNIYPSPGMDEVELASLVSRQIAFQMRKGAA